MDHIVDILASGQNIGLTAQSLRFAYKLEAGFLAHKLSIVRIPGVRNGGAVRDNQYVLGLNGLAKVVYGKGLSKPGLRIPKELTVFISLIDLSGLLDSLILVLAKTIWNDIQSL